jgi:hypothetical protein
MIVIVIDNKYFYFKTKPRKMKNIKKNWKTTVLGLVTIIVGLFTSKGKLDAASGTAILSGVGLILAKDSDKTGIAKEGEDNGK